MRRRTYFVLGTVAVVSLASAYFLPANVWLRELAAIPFVGALAGIVVKVFMDELAHMRARELEERRHAQQLAIASHMAERTFDKHVAFVEEYFQRMDAGLRELSQKGPGAHALNLATALRDIRQQYSPWLTQTIDDRLFPFEHWGLRVMGAKARAYEDLPVGERRSQLVQETHEAFMVVIGLEKEETQGGDEEEKKAVAASTILQRLREILGVAGLTTLRERALREALKATADRD